MNNKESGKCIILCVEDQIGYIAGVEKFLSPYPQYEISWAISLVDAQKVIASNKPHIILLDLALSNPPNIDDALEFMDNVRANLPEIKVVIYSGANFIKPKYVERALNAGVSYLVKEDNWTGKELDCALQIAMLGGVVYSQAVVQRFKGVIHDEESLLTRRQIQVAKCVFMEMTNNQIAQNLHISVPRARDIVSEIMEKVHCESRAGIALWYQKNYPQDDVNITD